MFHHLDLGGKRAMLREARRVLRPGGSLHLLDLGGTVDRSDGFLARRAYRNPRLRDNLGDRIPELMREAALADPTEVAHRVKLVGRLTFYRAHAPHA
jgi:ubiquinone/menaquinone biosynthesis C-methylase UbiE